MEKIKLSDIVSISGNSGLFKIIGKSRSGIVVESMNKDKRRMSVPVTAKISVLSEIAMFSETEDVNLGRIILNLSKQEITIPGKGAQPGELRSFMEKALPGYDESRVYLSHIQKLANWYGIIKDCVDLEAINQEIEEQSGSPEDDKKNEEESGS